MEEETEYVNGVEVLAGLCDEHGLQHWDSEAMACDTHIFVDKAGNPHECWESPSGMVNVVIAMTPEQAVMLGTETCHNVGDPSDFCCSECGVRMFTESNDTYTMIDSLGNIIEQPNFCPNCGAKVVDE